MSTPGAPADPGPLLTEPQALLRKAATSLLDPQARSLAAAVQWWELPGFDLRWPVAVVGEGPPVLLLHGFDSSFLEFRRLVPLLMGRHQLLVPDLHGFGFCPRPQETDYGPEAVLRHLEALLDALAGRSPQEHPPAPVGLIGASMGGSVAMELARRRPERIDRLLLLAPAGLSGRPMPLPPGLDALGVAFLSLREVRHRLCRSAFADPEAAVGPAELEISSLHLNCPGWGPALRRFARSGGFGGCGLPLPPQPLQVLWGENDRILRPPLKRAAQSLLGERLRELSHCGHLPHIDRPDAVADVWRQPACAFATMA